MRLGTLVTCACLAALAACGGVDEEAPVERITVPSGATLNTVSDSLFARGIIGSQRSFELLAKLTGRQTDIKAGIYDFRHGTSMHAVLDALVQGQEAVDELVLREGLMLSEVTEEVHAQLGINVDSFAEAVRDSTLLAEVGAEADDLEGYLYPSTYHVRASADAVEVVGQMVAEFQRRWKPEWNSRLAELGMSRHEIVTLASIIEGEVQDRTDSRLVSSVYHNRLRRGMRLQADPTVIYALGERRRLFERDYSIRSRYNTYRIHGLPPGPINQPSVSSIEAALYPANTDFLYFVASSGGRHVFTRTYREHLAAIRRVRDPGSGS